MLPLNKRNLTNKDRMGVPIREALFYMRSLPEAEPLKQALPQIQCLNSITVALL